MNTEYRVAKMEDLPALEELIPLSARKLQTGYYSPVQPDGAIGTVFGVDTQLIRDGTYFVAVSDGQIVGCGGWSKRKTLYGGDKGKTADDPLRDPSIEPAMIRAFFVHPEFARRGIGREFVRLSESAAFAAGFHGIDIVATLAGEPLYASCGYSVVERYAITLVNGALMPVLRMQRRKEPPPEPTPTAGTSPAEQARVPAAGVAHL
jgi:GNAT superfamily N-acetyltransferase